MISTHKSRCFYICPSEVDFIRVVEFLSLSEGNMCSRISVLLFMWAYVEYTWVLIATITEVCVLNNVEDVW